MMAGGGAAHAQQAAPEAGSPPAAAPELREEQIQDWTVVCGSPREGAPEQCEMRQHITDAEGNTLVLAVVGQLPNRSEPGMLVLMPLGIYLPAGVALQIDNGPEVPLEVQRCIQGSCQVELLLEGDIMRQMKAGTKATVTYAGQNQQGQVGRVQAAISLLGFTAALGRVQG
jgi:invasion protein IalB